MDSVVDEACVDGYRSRRVVVDVLVELSARWRGGAKIWACTSAVLIGYNKRTEATNFAQGERQKQAEKQESQQDHSGK